MARTECQSNCVHVAKHTKLWIWTEHTKLRYSCIEFVSESLYAFKILIYNAQNSVHSIEAIFVYVVTKSTLVGRKCVATWFTLILCLENFELLAIDNITKIWCIHCVCDVFSPDFDATLEIFTSACYLQDCWQTASVWTANFTRFDRYTLGSSVLTLISCHSAH